VPRVTLRYWASLRAAAGKPEEIVEAATLAEALASARRLNDAPRFSAVLGICSVVVDGVPVGRRDQATVNLDDGSIVELLPPFAGG
jgi:molybdopterin synthase sulfur carrier subunit